MSKVDFRLNAIVDGSLRDVGDLAQLAALAVNNGATLVQYRDKAASTRVLVEQALAIKNNIAGSNVPLLINDRVDVALAAGANGVHLGRDDMDAKTARRLLGPDAIIGLTVKNEADAEIALSSPVDYVCIGGVYETLSKHNPDLPVGVDGFTRLRALFSEEQPDLPVGAIAGIDAIRVSEIVRAGASGIAVISAIFRAPDISTATKELRKAVDANLGMRS